MGANAQTSVPAFTAGQVLTAAQMTQVNTGIPVFASSTERNAAFGGAGEKTLAEGQMAYLEDTNATQYYDGSSWISLGGTSKIASGTFSGVTTVTVDGCFTSNHAFYIVAFTGLNQAGTTNAVQWRTSGSTDTAASYIYSRVYHDTSAIAWQAAATTATSVAISNVAATVNQSIIMRVWNASQAFPTMSDIVNISNNPIPVKFSTWSSFGAATAHDGFIFTFGGNASGTYHVWGFSA